MLFVSNTNTSAISIITNITNTATSVTSSTASLTQTTTSLKLHCANVFRHVPIHNVAMVVDFIVGFIHSHAFVLVSVLLFVPMEVYMNVNFCFVSFCLQPFAVCFYSLTIFFL